MMVEDDETLLDTVAKDVKVLAPYIGSAFIRSIDEMLKKEGVVWFYTIFTYHLATEV